MTTRHRGDPAGVDALLRAPSHPVSTACRIWSSGRIRNRHTVLPAGIAPVNPKRNRTAGSRAVQSAIAANVAAPASTAHTATASRLVNRYRTPRRSRGIGRGGQRV
jgi:hypothetical protein